MVLNNDQKSVDADQDNWKILCLWPQLSLVQRYYGTCYDLLFEFLLKLFVLILHLGLGLQHCLQLPLQHILLTGQLIQLQYQVFIHHIQGIPIEKGKKNSVLILYNTVDIFSSQVLGTF